MQASNPFKRKRLTLLMLSASLFMTSCNNSNDLAEGGIEGTGIDDGISYASVGTVTGFGSIYVNGIHYQTDTSEVTVNHETSNENALQLGMVVQVFGTVNEETNEGVADKVVYDQNLEGVITAIEEIDGQSKQITVLGQTILVEDFIEIEGTTFETLAVGNVIEISGYNGTSYDLVASRIELIESEYSGQELLELEGTISALNTEQQEFQIKGQTIMYSNAQLDLMGETIRSGMKVEIQGQGLDENNNLIADQITLKTIPVQFEQSSAMSIEGIVSGFQSIDNFYVNGIQVDASSANFIQGSQNQLSDNVKVTIKGAFEAVSGSAFKINAKSIRFQLKGDSKVQASVIDIDSNALTFNLSGIEVQAESYTCYKDNTPSKNKYFHFDDLAIGDKIQARGSVVNNQFIATEIKRLNSMSDGISLTGYITTKTADQITVLGTALNLSALEDWPTIMDTLDIGDKVAIEGNYDSGVIVVTQLSAED